VKYTISINNLIRIWVENGHSYIDVIYQQNQRGSHNTQRTLNLKKACTKTIPENCYDHVLQFGAVTNHDIGFVQIIIGPINIAIKKRLNESQGLFVKNKQA